MRIKHDVLGYQPSCATLHSDLETLRLSIGERDYLAIVLVDEEGQRTPLGVVRATTLRKELLGTVSQRDFSNPDEMRMAPYLTVISVMDHHKSILHTRTPIQALLADVQSCNVLVAEQCFLLNDRYGGYGARDVSSYYVHPLREYLQYFYCLHAILDDTDLLSKVGMRDVQCVASLLSRLKTLCTGVETEAISFVDLPETPEGIKAAAEKLLQTPDLHALYIALHQQREKEVERSLVACARNGDLALFSDTKQQNDCCRIGQIKLFQGNQATYKKYSDALLKVWLQEAEARAKHDSEYDLHLMMISTLQSPTKPRVKNVKKQSEESEEQSDALWIWAAPTPMGMSHLTRFLSTFQHLSVFQEHPPWVTLYGAKKREWQALFMQNFKVAQSIELESQDEAQEGTRKGNRDEIRNGTQDETRTFAIIHYPCGVVNSRKTMISPFLPFLVGKGRNEVTG